MSAVMSVLFDATLKGSALLLLAWGITRVFRGASAAAKHLIWGAALGAMAMIPLLSLVVPRVGVRALEPISAAALLRSSEPVSVPRAAAEMALQAPRARMSMSMAAPRARAFDTASSRAFDAARFAAALWLAVAALVLLRIALGALRIALWSRRAYPVADGAWLSLSRHVAAELNISRPVTLLRSERACVPMTWGVVYPTVLLPVDCDEWTGERRSVVLLHEMAHVKRLDALTQLGAQFVVALFWFNPLVWFAARQMRMEREHACDDFVLEGGARATDYAYDLLQIARSLGGRSVPVAALAMARRSELEGRLLAILDPQTNHRGVTRARLALATVCMFALALPLAAFGSPRARGVERRGVAPRAIARVNQQMDTVLKVWPMTAPRGRAYAVAALPARDTAATPVAKANQPPDRETLVAVAKAAAKMSSDFEKAELLITIAKYYSQDAELCKAYLDVVASMSSDNDRSRAMLRLLSTENGPSAPARDAVIIAASGLQSDYSRGQTIAAITKSGDLTNAQIIELVGVASSMTGSYEKANALIGIVSRQSIIDADTRKAVLRAAESITSATDYRRVVSTILK